jgi:NADH-quinone oxidoreductase subunit M
MVLFVALLTIGWALAAGLASDGIGSQWAMVPLLLAVLIRSGIAPFHCWMTDLFEHASFGTALLFVTPIAGAYAAARLVLPIAPPSALHALGLVSLFTAVYAAALALVQRDVRRFFCYLFLSHSALVLVGLEMSTTVGLTGGLCIWLSVGLALCGFGLTVRALEARRGRLSLESYQGLYEHTPNLAMCFGLTGFASIGFPGTFGFIGTELLVDGAVEASPYVAIAVVVAAAINGIAVVSAYFRLFSGTRYFSSVSLQIAPRERYAVLGLATLILILGLVPQPGVASRYHAAEQIIENRAALAASAKTPVDPAATALHDRSH